MSSSVRIVIPNIWKVIKAMFQTTNQKQNYRLDLSNAFKRHLGIAPGATTLGPPVVSWLSFVHLNIEISTRNLRVRLVINQLTNLFYQLNHDIS
jgi:hypothetical protein